MWDIGLLAASQPGLIIVIIIPHVGMRPFADIT
jgi:hypothetical protein